MDYILFDVALREWLWIVLLWMVITIGLIGIKRFFVWRLQALAQRTGRVGYEISADIISRTKVIFLVLVSVYAAGFVAAVPFVVERVLSVVAFLALLLQIAIWGNALLSRYVTHYRDTKIEEDASAVMTVQAMGFIGRLTLYAVIFLLALDNFGVEVTALVAGLGIGGIAVALAIQNILGDLFASLSIVLDKPFVVGDFLIVDGYLGTVEYVGLKTTRVRSLSGEQIVFSNSDLLNSRIRNYKRMYERRIVFSLNVKYETPYEKVKRVPEIIRNVVEEQDLARFDRSHFFNFAEYALEFETVYFVKVPDYNTYMDVQQQINLRIIQEFEKEGIKFAYPARSVHMEPVSVRVNETGVDAEVTNTG